MNTKEYDQYNHLVECYGVDVVDALLDILGTEELFDAIPSELEYFRTITEYTDE